MWNDTRAAFSQERSFERCRHLALQWLVCPGRHTVTGALCAGGRQFHDWSADYRVLQRLRPEGLFRPIIKTLCKKVAAPRPLCICMDTTEFRKTGRKVPGARWRRDPLGPAFQANLIWAQRFLQTSALLPELDDGPCRARGVPVALGHCPGMKNKPPKEADMKERELHKQAVKQLSAPVQAIEQLCGVRKQVDGTEGGRDRVVVCGVDGGLTNSSFLNNLPDKTVAIGRIRKDAVLYSLPREEQQPKGKGRKRCYGDPAPTPEQLRQDKEHPWQTVKVFGAGKEHDVQIKTLASVRWKGTGARHDARLIVIRPLAYKPPGSQHTYYRQPAYLYCTDHTIPVADVVQYYFWRWEIEVNFREEKTILGAGEAQVRHPASVENAPALLVAAYAMMLLADAQLKGEGEPTALAVPKWRHGDPPTRDSAQQLLNALRAELLAAELEQIKKTGFTLAIPRDARPQKITAPFIVASVYQQK